MKLLHAAILLVRNYLAAGSIPDGRHPCNLCVCKISQNITFAGMGKKQVTCVFRRSSLVSREII